MSGVASGSAHIVGNLGYIILNYIGEGLLTDYEDSTDFEDYSMKHEDRVKSYSDLKEMMEREKYSDELKDRVKYYHSKFWEDAHCFGNREWYGLQFYIELVEVDGRDPRVVFYQTDMDCRQNSPNYDGRLRFPEEVTYVGHEGDSDGYIHGWYLGFDRLNWHILGYRK